MQAIKALVIGMGVLIVGGLALLGYGLTQKSARLAAPPPAVQVATAPSPPITPATFGQVLVPVAPGAKVLRWQAASDHLAVLVEEAGVRRLILLDPARGEVRGSFVFTSPP